MTRFSTNLRLNIIRREPNLGPPRFPGRNQKGQSTSGPATKAIRCSPPFFAAPGLLKRKRHRRKGSEPEAATALVRLAAGLRGFLPSKPTQDPRNKAGSKLLCPAWFRLLAHLPELQRPHRDSTTVERRRETLCSAHCRSNAPGNRARHRLERRWCGRR